MNREVYVWEDVEALFRGFWAACGKGGPPTTWCT